VKNLLLLLVIIVAMISCESSSQRSYQLTTKNEKVAIIDGTENPIHTNTGFYYTYKVKRIEKGVVTYITIKGKYEKNDTLLVPIIKFNY